MTAPDPRLGEIEGLAKRFLVANSKMIELGFGIGHLAIVEPEMYEDWTVWDNLAGNSHADTVLHLLTELRKRDEVIAKLSAWAGRYKSAYYDEAQDDVVQIIRPVLRAAVTAAKGDGE